ncbi:MAG: hypothetical protein ACO1SX_17840 [Actinomycetota bacterium]
MSFRLGDLKKSVRKGRDGYQVTPGRLESRQHLFQVEFVLQQFEQHLGRPRRELDPDVLMDFVGDSRLGRGLLATLSQWYRMRARTFPELLDARQDGGRRYARLLEHGISGPVELRAWLYRAANLEADGFVDPPVDEPYWKSRTRALALRREALAALSLLDRPEEAVLVRTGPRPPAADVVAAYNARAHTTLLRSAAEVTLTCAGPTSTLTEAARLWAEPLGVEWSVEPRTLRLSGFADTLGCWTRHGRKVERAALELLALPDLGVREVCGRLRVGDKECRFRWKEDVLSALRTAAPAPLVEALPERLEWLAALLRRERERGEDTGWGFRQPSHLLAVDGRAWLPHLEVRRGDLGVYLRVGDPDREPELGPFVAKTLVAVATGVWEAGDPVTLHFPGGKRVVCGEGAVLATLVDWLEAQQTVGDSSLSAPQVLLQAA